MKAKSPATARKALAIASALILQAGCAQALSPAEREEPSVMAEGRYLAPARRTQTLQTVGNQVRISIKDRATSSRLPIYLYGGEYWIVGQSGQGYSINFRSAFNRRVLATTSVDGINIITGEAAGYVQRGYILSPHTSYDVTGWRKSEHEVAAFNFARPEASYAAQTGRPANVGVIGVAVFPELHVPPPPTATPVAPSISQSTKASANSSASSGGFDNMAGKMKSEAVAEVAKKDMAVAPSSGLGTQHGARESSYSPTSAFRRESNVPTEIIQLRYDTADNLVARGVLQWTQPMPRPYVQPRPQSFSQSGSYVPDPK
jgi:hypothetical protein